MKQTIKYKLNPTKEQSVHLSNLCFYATKLYNTDNYQRRKAWDETGKIPNWMTQKKILKDNHWYKLLPSQTAQEVSHNLQGSYNSWFKLRKKDSTANPPMFRKKAMLSVISFYQQFKVLNGKLRLSMSRKYAEEQKLKHLELSMDLWKIENGTPKFCQIVNDKDKWFAHIVYEVAEQLPILNDKVMAVDLGIVNTGATCDSDGNTEIYTGKQILAIQHYFNKERAKLTSIVTKQNPKKHTSRALNILAKKQSRQINQCLHTHTKNIIKKCIQRGIRTLVVGDLTDIRKGKDFGSIGNLKLHSWAFSKLTALFEYKCIKAGIRFVTVSEAYTSQTCSHCGTVRKSNRKHRGLYVCKHCGHIINADVNGAVNILKKYLRDFLSRSIGDVASPSVARITNVCPCEV